MNVLALGRTVTAAMVVAAVGAAVVSPGSATAAPPAGNVAVLTRADYADRLRAMWLGESIANWTGLKTENLYSEPPFLTDSDWGSNKGSTNPYIGAKLEFAQPPPGLAGRSQRRDVWPADDDTDIEYVYLHAMATTFRDVRLTPERIADTWGRHVKRDVWASNSVARRRMEQGALPPTTGMSAANHSALMIDAQLTTEIFGALAPGLPEEALRLADLPIRTTAESHAAHAAQFFVLLYALAPRVDQAQPRREQMVWLAREARRYLPDSSKAADIIDFVMGDFLANGDVTNWESTRDKIYRRYQAEPGKNGFIYRSLIESSINMATGVMALLYGQGSFKDTVRIATLSGWDSDNSTASLGGLYGLLYGTAALQAEFPDRVLYDKYWVAKTRDGLPDHLPGDPEADDTFTLMANRMLPLVDQVVRESGGTTGGDSWRLPARPAAPDPASLSSLATANPLSETYRRSANNRVRRDGGTVRATLSPAGFDQPAGEGEGLRWAALFADGREANFSGVEPPGNADTYAAAKGADGKQTFTVEYDRVVPVQTVRAVFGASPGLRSASVQYRGTDNAWRDAPSGSVWTRQFSSRPFLQNDLLLSQTVDATGIRLVGTLGATTLTTMAELDALSPPGPGATTVVEAESLLPTLNSTAPAGLQINCCGLLWSGDAQLLVRSTKVGDRTSITFTAPTAGRYQLALANTRAPDFGTVRTSVNGIALGGFTYGTSSGFDVTRQVLGEVELRAGANTLTFEVTGTASSSAGYRFGVDAIELRADG